MSIIDVNSIGIRKVKRIVTKFVENPDTGLSSQRQVVVEDTMCVPDITLEEAKQIGLLAGAWRPVDAVGPMGDKYQTKVANRRFFITKEIYLALFPPPEPEPDTVETVAEPPAVEAVVETPTTEPFGGPPPNGSKPQGRKRG